MNTIRFDDLPVDERIRTGRKIIAFLNDLLAQHLFPDADHDLPGRIEALCDADRAARDAFSDRQRTPLDVVLAAASESGREDS